MKTIDDLREFRKTKPTDEEYKNFLKELTDEEWKGISEQLAPNPYKGKLAKLRKEAKA